MKFRWLTTDGRWHEKIITDHDEILKFIEWLETNSSVIKWR